jgi:hypothetical protein
LALGATVGADRIVHLAVVHALRLACVATVLATLGSAQVLTRIELLFTICERELCTAIAALELLISHKTEKRK